MVSNRQMANALERWSRRLRLGVAVGIVGFFLGTPAIVGAENGPSDEDEAPRAADAESEKRGEEESSGTPSESGDDAEGESAWTREYEIDGEPLSERREKPDIDGLPDEGPSAGEVLLYVPRTIFFPVYLTTNYLVRWPLGKVFTAIERYHAVEFALAALTFADGDAGFLPLFNIGGSRASSFGVRFFYNEIVDDTLDLDVGFHGLPNRNISGTLDVEFHPGTGNSRLEFRFAGEHRDDLFFYGVGLQPDGRGERFFTQRTIFSRLSWVFGGESTPGEGRIRARVSDRNISCSEDLGLDVCGDDHEFGTTDDRYPIDQPEVAPLNQDYTFGAVGTEFYLDTRSEVPDSGVRLQGETELGQALDDDELSVFRFGGELAGYVEFPWTVDRALGLRLRAESAAPIQDSQVPLGELVSMGGVELMRGFFDNRFRGRSLLLATLNYRYPVWSFFDGKIFAEAGQLTGDYWESTHLEETRASFGLGFRTKNLRSMQNSFALNAALGTSRFENGFSIEQFRVNLGTNWGF